MNLIDPKDLAEYFAPEIRQAVEQMVQAAMPQLEAVGERLIEKLVERMNGAQLQAQIQSTVNFPKKL